MTEKKNVKNQESVASFSQEDLKKAKKKRLTKIIAIVIASVIGLGIIGTSIAGFLTMNDEGSIFYKLFKRGSLSPPKNVRVHEFNQEKDSLVLIRWENVINATDYTLQIRYGLYSDEIISIDVGLNGRYIERKRGDLYYRVRANNLSGEGEFSHWQRIYIEPMQLDLPTITMERQGDQLIVSWTEVKFTFEKESKRVYYYELIDGGYFYDDEEPEYWGGDKSIFTSDNQYSFPIGLLNTDVFTIKVRPLNYTILNNEKINLPARLYDIYETPDEWAEAEYIVKE